MTNRVIVGLVLCFWFAVSMQVGWAQYAGSENIPDSLKTGFDSITAEQSREWLTLLAGPTFEGRGTGQVGYSKAAHWIAGKCAEYGLTPMGEGNTYFQMLPMTRLTVDADESRIIGPNQLDVLAEGNLGLERFADQAVVTGNVVFLRMKGDISQIDDNIELRDKIVIYVADDAAQARAPFAIARKGPAAALRVISERPRSSSQLLQQGRRQRSTSISGTISRSCADAILESVGGEKSWLEFPADAGVQSQSTQSELTLQLTLRQESAGVPNVVAWLEGSDPELSHEFIILGAHLDHLGARTGSIYPGADDNGSGSTALLNMARALTLNPVKPKRSVLMIWFAAEEVGLVGSRHFVENSTVSLDNAICMLNTDMVGRNEEKPGETAEENATTLHLIGSRRGDPALHEVILEANKYVGFEFEYDEEGVFGRSDQASFYRNGLSVAFLFGGFHPDYHQPSDTPDRINYDKVASAAKLFYVTVHLATEHGKFAAPSENGDGQSR